MSRREETEAGRESVQGAQVARLQPTPWRYFVIVITAVWHTVRDARGLYDYLLFGLALLAVAGIVVTGIAINWILLPIGAAALAWVGLVRGGYGAWRDEVRMVIATQARMHEIGVAAEHEARGDPNLHLRIERQRLAQAELTSLLIRCTNESAEEIVDLSARIVGEETWANGDLKERPVAAADCLEFAGEGRFVRIGAGSPKNIYVALWSTGELSAHIRRFRAGPVPDGDYVGKRNPTATLHAHASDWELYPGRFRLTVAFEAPARRTQEERLCFSLNPSGSGNGENGLNWIDPSTAT